MIALVLGLAIVAAVGTLSVNASRSYRILNQASEQIENGRYALTILKEDVEHAGFLGTYGKDASNPGDPCNLNLPITNPVLPVVYCDTLTSKRLIISRASSRVACSFNSSAGTNTCTPSLECQSLNPSYTYIQSIPSQYKLSTNCGPANGSSFSCPSLSLSKPSDPSCQADAREYIVISYELDLTSSTLYRQVLSRSEALREPVISGIKSMEIQFGLDALEPKDGTPDDGRYLNTSSVTDYSDVVSALIKLKACTAINQTETCRDFSQAIRVIHSSGRRE